MAASARSRLPERFRPLFDQSQTQTDLRYGAQRDALGQILGQLSSDYGRQRAAQDTAGQTITGALRGSKDRIQQAYTDAGLTPTLLQQLAGSPTGQRLAGDLARNLSSADQQMTNAMAGQQFLQGRLADDYRQDVGQVQSQASSLANEQGLYQSNLLNELIGGDRAARSQANTAARAQAHEDEQAILDREARERQSWIGAGIDPNSGSAIPGGRADKKKPSLKPASQATIKSASGTLSKLRPLVKTLWESGTSRQAAGRALLQGRKGAKGEPVYDPQTGKRALNPDGTQKTTGGRSEVPSFERDQPLLQAALDITYDGHVSPATAKLLRKAYGNGIITALGLSTDRGRPKPQRPQANPQGVFADPVSPPTIG